MKKNQKANEPTIKRGNLTVPNPKAKIIPKYVTYSVTRHDLPSPDESNIPIPDEENVIQSKKFADQNHLD